MGDGGNGGQTAGIVDVDVVVIEKESDGYLMVGS